MCVFQNLIRSPWLSLIILLVLFLASVVGVTVFPSTPEADRRSFWLSCLAFTFTLLSWLIFSAREWPYMQVDGLPGETTCLMKESQSGDFFVVAPFRLLNRGYNTNTVLSRHYQLWVEENPIWHPIPEPRIGASFEDWVRDRRNEGPDAFLDLPEVYSANTAKVRHVVFSCKIPHRLEGNETPRSWLKARFEMAEGPPQEAHVELRWSGKPPATLISSRVW